MSSGNESCGGCNCETPEVDHSEVLAIVEKHGREATALLSILSDIQSRYRCLPEEALRLVAKETGRSLVDVYGAATFYKSFSLEPKGKHVVCVCMGTACHVRGSAHIVQELERELGISRGQTTPDREFTLETANCLGACALGPVVVVDGTYHSKTRQNRVRRLLEDALKSDSEGEVTGDPRNFPIELLCHMCGHSLMDETHLLDGLPSVVLTVSSDTASGHVRLSSLYGSPHVETEADVGDNAVVTFSCPHCGQSLEVACECPECQSPMVPLSVKGGGTLYICSRNGCKSHLLDLVDTIGWGGIPPVVITR